MRAVSRRFSWLAGLIFSLVLIYLWPRTVVPRSDDFGYLESVVAAIRDRGLGRSDWLEPFNCVLPAISAAMFALTQSFYAATLGIAALVALVNFGLLWLWLRSALPTASPIAGIVLSAAICPVWMNKTLEFTGVPLGWTLFLAALLAWRARAATWFFILVVVGFLNRQSIVCLLMLPFWQTMENWRRGEPLDRRWLIGLVLASVAVGASIAGMPANFARTLTALHASEVRPLQRVAQALLGIGLCGGMAALWALLRGERHILIGRETARAPWPVIAWLTTGAVVMLAGAELHCETPQLNRIVPLLVVAAFGLSAALPGALLRVAPEMLVAVALYVGLVAWRGVWWDYYLIEPALLLAWPRTPPTDVSRSVSVASVAMMLALGVVWLGPLRWQLRWAERQVAAYEQALREGRITVAELSQAPFGYLGWKVFPALVQRGPDPSVRLSDFVKFVEAGRSYYANGSIVRETTAMRRSLHGSGECWELPAGYRPRRFPLRDDEWHEWLRTERP